MAATVFRRTPGVYVTELTAFPPSVVAVQTAIPAFIGYTEKASVNGKPVSMQAIPISSMADFQAIFGGDVKSLYTLTEVTDPNTEKYDFKIHDPNDNKAKYYKLNQTEDTNFNLYTSMQLFYANGGGNCWVVSVGNYKKEDGTANKVATQPLVDGLAVIQEQVGPTMLVVPEAVLLDRSGLKSVATKMLDQCGLLQDRVALLDVYDSLGVTDQLSLDKVIGQFRTDIGDKFLNYGMAYFPFLDTSLVSASDINYTNIADSSFTTFRDILKWQNDNLYKTANPGRHALVLADITAIEPTDPPANDPTKVTRLDQNLVAALPILGEIEQDIALIVDVVPPSPAMAGVYTFTDGSKGVWNAPANLSLTSVDKPTYKLNGDQQGDLNVPVSGKAVNAIREFPNRGSVVWGARTLDGNSNDYRYIQVRRTLIYIEQSIKNALNQFVFAPNDGNTWATVTAMVSSFLQGVWSQSGLMGSTASEAFSVQCGVGSTMTNQDVLDGYMRVQVVLQMIRPAEFIELTFKQKMEGVG